MGAIDLAHAAWPSGHTILYGPRFVPAARVIRACAAPDRRVDARVVRGLFNHKPSRFREAMREGLEFARQWQPSATRAILVPSSAGADGVARRVRGGMILLRGMSPLVRCRVRDRVAVIAVDTP